MSVERFLDVVNGIEKIFRQLKNLLILDVDGVMTDGTKLYDVDGKVIGKRFCDHDFTAIKKFKENGWAVCWLSADKNVNEAQATERGIDFWFSRDDDGTIDKVKWLHKLVEHYGVNYENTVYVGDDLFDLPVMKALRERGGKAFCPSNAVPQLTPRVGMFGIKPGDDYFSATPLSSAGGAGAIMELLVEYFPGDDPFSPPVCG